MKVIVFGASRGTGHSVVKLALDQGHYVTALARHTGTLQTMKSQLHDDGRLTLIEGDILSPECYERQLQGKDAVISVVGVNRDKPTTLYSQGIFHVVNAMSKWRVPRLICVSALGVEVTPGMSLPLKLATRFVLQPLLRNTFSDMLRMEALVKKSELKWTIVRPPRLIDRNLSGRYRVALNDHVRHPLTIGRDDLAHFILKAIDHPDTFCSTIEVAY